jgi:hypothetical protein
MAADILTLGDIVFTDFSIPERFPFGGAQAMRVIKLVGGQRVIQTMGPDDRDITWGGVFWGDNALYQALSLDALRAQGAALPLSWGGGGYTVVIGSFEPNVRRLPFCVPYTITCVVATSGAQGALGGSAQGIDSLASSDLSSASAAATNASNAQGIVSDEVPITSSNIG